MYNFHNFLKAQTHTLYIIQVSYKTSQVSREITPISNTHKKSQVDCSWDGLQ